MRLNVRVLNLKGLWMHVACVESNRSGFLGLGFIGKQRSGYGLNYRLLAIMRGYNPRTFVCPMLSS